MWCRARRSDGVRRGSHGGRTFEAEASLRRWGRPSPRGRRGEQRWGCGHVVSGTGPGVPEPVRARLPTRRQAESLNRCVAAWWYLSSVIDTDRVAATRALQRGANEFLLFLQAHEYQFDIMMKPERVFSGQRLNPSRIQDWFGGEKHFPEIAQLVRPCRSRGSVCVASQGGLAPALRHSCLLYTSPSPRD